MRVKPRLVAIDVDDTLLTEELVVPKAAVEAIAAARKGGVRVVLATGRMYASVRPHALAAGVDGPIIAYNGGLVRALDGETLQHRPVPLPEALELVALAEEHDLCLNVYVDDRLYVRRMDEHASYYVSIAQVPAHVTPDLRAALTAAPTKVLLVADPPVAEAWRLRLAEAYAGRLSVARSKPRFVEITALGVNKGVALAELAAALAIERAEVMAIGDSLNDLAMLEWAGLSVAVGNAVHEVKAKVDYVTAGNAAEGVTEAFHRFVL